MGDSADFHFGKQPSGGSLEFVGQKRRSLFAQYTDQFNGSSSRQQPVVPQQQAATPVQPQQYGAAIPKDEQAYLYQAPIGEMPAQQPDSQDYSTLFAEDDEVMNDIPSLNIQHTNDTARRTKGKKLHVEKKERPSIFKVLFGTFASCVGIAVVVVSALYIVNMRPAVPSDLKAQAGFPVYEMAPNSQFSIDKKSVEINKNGSLVYIVYQKDNNAKFVISQQSVPDIVKDDAAYQQFLTETDKFASLESDLGKVYFTKPAGIGSDISAVVKSDKTLMFIRADGKTSEQSWSNLISTIKQ